jgi:hypothetical protein
MESVRLILAVVAHEGWWVHHMDVKSTFLNGDLNELVFVKQLPGFPVSKEEQVLKLKKALYGLRQAPRAWYAKLHCCLNSLGSRTTTMNMQCTPEEQAIDPWWSVYMWMISWSPEHWTMTLHSSSGRCRNDSR